MLLEERVLLAAGVLLVQGVLPEQSVLLPGTVLLAEGVLLVEASVVCRRSAASWEGVLFPRIAVLICYPSLPLSRHVWSNVAPEVSLPMDAGVSSFDPRLVSSRPTGFTDGHFLNSRCRGSNHLQLCHTSRSSLKCQLHSDITCWQFLYTSSLVTLPACAVHSPAF